MEAKAKHDFTQTADDELGFKRGDVLKILNQTEDANWFKASLGTKVGYVPKNYILMDNVPWFFKQGVVSRSESENILLKKNRDGSWVQPDGAFLVRNSESSPGDFSLSVKYCDGVQHFKIMSDELNKYFLWIKKFDSVNKLVDYHKTASVARRENILLCDLVADDDMQEHAPEPPQQIKQAKAPVLVRGLYDFVPQEDCELGFSKGDTIEVLDQRDKNWWMGRRNGQEGQFPSTYVAKICP